MRGARPGHPAATGGHARGAAGAGPSGRVVRAVSCMRVSCDREKSRVDVVIIKSVRHHCSPRGWPRRRPWAETGVGASHQVPGPGWVPLERQFGPGWAIGIARGEVPKTGRFRRIFRRIRHATAAAMVPHGGRRRAQHPKCAHQTPQGAHFQAGCRPLPQSAGREVSSCDDKQHIMTNLAPLQPTWVAMPPPLGRDGRWGAPPGAGARLGAVGTAVRAGAGHCHCPR